MSRSTLVFAFCTQPRALPHCPTVYLHRATSPPRRGRSGLTPAMFGRVNSRRGLLLGERLVHLARLQFQVHLELLLLPPQHHLRRVLHRERQPGPRVGPPRAARSSPASPRPSRSPCLFVSRIDVPLHLRLVAGSAASPSKTISLTTGHAVGRGRGPTEGVGRGLARRLGRRRTGCVGGKRGHAQRLHHPVRLERDAAGESSPGRSRSRCARRTRTSACMVGRVEVHPELLGVGAEIDLRRRSRRRSPVMRKFRGWLAAEVPAERRAAGSPVVASRPAGRRRN